MPNNPGKGTRKDLAATFESSHYKPKKTPGTLLGRAVAALKQPIGKPAREKASRQSEPAPKPPSAEYIDEHSPWHTDASSFPAAAPMEARLRFCLRYAVLAPSSHNTQPWLFRLDRRVCDVRADRTRALPVCDPHDRELTVSVGCALQHLRLALRRFGIDARTTLLPDPNDHDLMARVEAGDKRPPTPEERTSFDAIPHRRTCRHAFKPDDPPPGLIERLRAAATDHGVTLVVIKDLDDRRRFAALVHEADVVQFNHRPFRRELALWMHHNRTRQHDGIPGYALGLNELESVAAPLIVRTFDTGDGRGAKDEQLALQSPVLAVLSTELDDPRAWLNTGQALAEILLRATAAGLSASYLNQPVELPDMRARLHRLVGGPPHPQIVLRLGVGPKTPHTPRRDPVTINEP